MNGKNDYNYKTTPEEQRYLRSGLSVLLPFISAVIGVIGGLIIAACIIYQSAFHPEWTEAQSFIILWKFYALGAALIIFASGWVWRDHLGQKT